MMAGRPLPDSRITTVRGVAHWALHYRDITAPFNFFTTALGLTPLMGMIHAGQRIVILGTHGSRIELVESQEAREEFESMHLAFKVRSIDQAVRLATRAEYRVLGPVREPVWGLREVDIAGPGGLMIQLVEQRWLKLAWSTLRVLLGGFSRMRQFPVLKEP